MAFDVLQRWHENNHLDTSGYRITPYHRTPVPRRNILPALALALDKILPELDPLRMAQRRQAMAALPLQQRRLALAGRQMDLTERYGLPMQESQYKAMKRAYDTPGALNPATFKPWTQGEKLQQRKLEQKQMWDHGFNQFEDAARAWENNAHPAHQPDQSSIDSSQSPLPGLGGPSIPEVTVGEPQDVTVT